MAQLPRLKLIPTHRPSGKLTLRQLSDKRRSRSIRSALPTFNSAAITGIDWQRILLAVSTVIALSVLFSLHLLPDTVPLHAGEISDRDVRAARPARFPDSEATDAMRRAAVGRVEPVYTSVPYAASEAFQSVSDVFAAVRDEARNPAPNSQRLAANLRQHIGVVVPKPQTLDALLQDTAHMSLAEHSLQDVVKTIMDDEIRSNRPDDIRRARAGVATLTSKAMIPRSMVPAVTQIGQSLIRSNRELDRERTLLSQNAERNLVPQQYGQIFAGDVVIRTGETVSNTTIEKLRSLGLQNPRLDAATIASVTLLTAAMVALVCIYLSRHHRAIYKSNKLLLMLSLLVTLSVLSLKLGDALLGVRLTPMQFGFVSMSCVAAVGMLIATLLNSRIAMMIVALLAAQSGLILGTPMGFVVVALLSGMVGIFAVHDIRDRNDLLRAGALLCTSNAVLCVIVSHFDPNSWSEFAARQYLAWALVSGCVSLGVFSLSTGLFERLFGVTTHLGLLELCDPNRRLLRDFCQLAPGTYTHSVMVGNLAVAAAEAIGADALLCRVGAYYHDLGKMRRAEFFVENQNGGDNIHERLHPSLSALVVTAHVKEGLEIAEQEKLPPVVKAFITEHHGTSLIKYFYHQHTSGDNVDMAPALEQHFRYAGPKPQSRETALLMLADGVEAASRTLSKPTLGRIEDLVDKIIESQLTDGQLDECDLTISDLRNIRSGFVRLLGGMLHSRIEYPEALKAAVKSSKNESTDRQSDELVAGVESDKSARDAAERAAAAGAG